MAGPEIGFLAALLTTVALLVGAAVTGRLKLYRRHVTFVALAVASLGVAIYFAIKTGPLYDLPAAGLITPVHLTIAKITTVLYLWPLITGPLAYRGTVSRRVHRVGAWGALAMTVVATVTGVWMLAKAPRTGPGSVDAPPAISESEQR